MASQETVTGKTRGNRTHVALLLEWRNEPERWSFPTRTRAGEKVDELRAEWGGSAHVHTFEEGDTLTVEVTL